MFSYLLLILLNFIVSATVTFCVNWLAAIRWRKAAAAHWTERARLLWPVRVSGAMNIWLIPAGLSSLEVAARQESLPRAVVPWIAGFVGAILATFSLDREIFPRLTFRAWRRLAVLRWAVGISYLSVFVAAALWMPDEPGMLMIVLGGVVLAFILALSYGLYLRILRWAGVLHPPDERLRGIVADTVRRMGARQPGTWLLDSPLAQAFALPATHDLMFSSRLLEICPDAEISAICAHELAHLTESRGVLAGRLAGSLTLYPLIFLRPALDYGAAGFTAIFLLICLTRSVMRKLSRRMEKRADKIATENQGEEGVYARALERLYSDSLLPAVNASASKTHPHLYDRMLAAGIQPDYPRPAKPGVMGWPALLIWIVFVILIVLSLMQGSGQQGAFR